jgi:hypothetical protein
VAVDIAGDGDRRVAEDLRDDLSGTPWVSITFSASTALPYEHLERATLG